MLVLTRKQKEVIRIGDNVTITILRIKGQSVRVGIDAPNDIRVVRGELATFSDDDANTSNMNDTSMTNSEASHQAAEFDLPSEPRPAGRSARPQQPSRPISRSSKANASCRASSREILTEAAKKVRQRPACKDVKSSSPLDDAAIAAGRVPMTPRMDLAMMARKKRQGFSKN